MEYISIKLIVKFFVVAISVFLIIFSILFVSISQYCMILEVKNYAKTKSYNNVPDLTNQKYEFLGNMTGHIERKNSDKNGINIEITEMNGNGTFNIIIEEFPHLDFYIIDDIGLFVNNFKANNDFTISFLDVHGLFNETRKLKDEEVIIFEWTQFITTIIISSDTIINDAYLEFQLEEFPLSLLGKETKKSGTIS